MPGIFTQFPLPRMNLSECLNLELNSELQGRMRSLWKYVGGQPFQWEGWMIKSPSISILGINLTFPREFKAKGWSLLNLNLLYWKYENRRHDSFYQMRLCIKFHNIVKCCATMIITTLSCPIVTHCTLFSSKRDSDLLLL